MGFHQYSEKLENSRTKNLTVGRDVSLSFVHRSFKNPVKKSCSVIHLRQKFFSTTFMSSHKAYLVGKRSSSCIFRMEVQLYNH
jgi:hypothetical protein